MFRVWACVCVCVLQTVDAGQVHEKHKGRRLQLQAQRRTVMVMVVGDGIRWMCGVSVCAWEQSVRVRKKRSQVPSFTTNNISTVIHTEFHGAYGWLQNYTILKLYHIYQPTFTVWRGTNKGEKGEKHSGAPRLRSKLTILYTKYACEHILEIFTWRHSFTFINKHMH